MNSISKNRVVSVVTTGNVAANRSGNSAGATTAGSRMNRSRHFGKHSLIAAAAVAALSSFASQSAQAALQYFDTTNASGLTAGTATWDAGTTSTWATSASPGTAAPTTWTNGNDAFFQTAGVNTVTISGTVIANSVTQTTNSTATTIGSGTLQIGSAGLTNSGNSAFTINSAVTLGASQTWNATAATTIGGAIGDGSNVYGITKTGTGTLTFSGANSNTYTGATLVQAGTLAITNGSGTVTRGASLTLGGGAAGTTATFTDTGVASTATNDTFTGALNIGSGRSIITLTPNATGQATVTFGSLGTRAAGSATTISGTIGGTPGVNNTSLIFTTAPSGSNFVGGGGAVTSSTASIIPWLHNASSNHFYGYDATKGVTQVSGEANNLTSGATTNVYTNSGTAMTMGGADRTINSLVGDNSGANITMGGQTLTVTSGAIMASIGLTIGSDTATPGTLALGSAEGQFSARSNRTLTVNSAITGIGGLTLIGDNASSNIILAGANTYTGVTNLYVGGNVKLTNSLAFQNTTVNYVNGNGMGLLFGNGGTTGQTAYTFGGLSGSANINLSNNNTTPQAVALTVGGNNDSTTYSGILSNTVAGGSLTKNGSGILTLSGASTFTGGVTLNAGTLQVGANSSGTVTNGPLGTGTLTLAGGTFGFTGGAFTIANAVKVTGATNIQVASGSTEVLSGNWGGSGNLTLVANGATGQWQFGGDNSGYSGSFTQNGGNTSLAFNSATAGSAGAAWAFNNPTAQRTRLNFGAGTINFGSISGNGSIANVAGSGQSTASVGALNSDTTFSGKIGDGTGQAVNIALTKVGTGTLTLSGASGYTGTTTVSEGTLKLASTGALASDTLVLGSASTTGTFDLSSKGAYTLASVTGRGTVQLADNATALTVSGTLAPGFSLGTVTVAGDLVLGGSSVSNFDVNGTTAGLYDLTQGTASTDEQVSFGGTLNVAFDSAWTSTITNNTSIQLFNFDAYASDFTTKNYTGLQSGQSASFDAATGTVTIAVPEPASLSLAVLGVAGLIVRRRRSA